LETVGHHAGAKVGIPEALPDISLDLFKSFSVAALGRSQLIECLQALLIKAQKYAILVIFIVAAVITPPDVVSQIMVAVPMILLYQLSILICGVIFRHKNRGTAGENDGETD
jgi:sec-independent protein translocase protein TatC